MCIIADGEILGGLTLEPAHRKKRVTEAGFMHDERSYAAPFRYAHNAQLSGYADNVAERYT